MPIRAGIRRRSRSVHRIPAIIRKADPSRPTGGYTADEQSVIQDLQVLVQALQSRIGEAVPSAIYWRNPDLADRALEGTEFPDIERRLTETLRLAATDQAGKELGALGGTLFAKLPQAEAWAERRAGDLITEVTDATRKAVRDVVARAIREGGHPFQQARTIRGMVGLNSRLSQAVVNYERGLRDAGLSEDRIASMVDRKTRALLRYRSETIARTETISANNMGKLTGWIAAQQQGLLAPEAGKQWIATDDDRIDDECLELDDEIVGINESFSLGYFAPPVHPNCRCTMDLVPYPVAQPSAEAQAPMAPSIPPGAPTPEELAPEALGGFGGIGGIGGIPGLSPSALESLTATAQRNALRDFEIREMANRGHTIAEIADRHGLSTTRVRNLLKEPMGRDVRDAAIRAMRDQGMTVKDISERVGLSTKRVGNILKETPPIPGVRPPVERPPVPPPAPPPVARPPVVAPPPAGRIFTPEEQDILDKIDFWHGDIDAIVYAHPGWTAEQIRSLDLERITRNLGQTRDEAIVRMANEGWTRSELARRFGLGEYRIGGIIRAGKGVPKIPRGKLPQGRTIWSAQERQDIFAAVERGEDYLTIAARYPGAIPSDIKAVYERIPGTRETKDILNWAKKGQSPRELSEMFGLPVPKIEEILRGGTKLPVAGGVRDPLRPYEDQETLDEVSAELTRVLTEMGLGVPQMRWAGWDIEVANAFAKTLTLLARRYPKAYEDISWIGNSRWVAKMIGAKDDPFAYAWATNGYEYTGNGSLTITGRFDSSPDAFIRALVSDVRSGFHPAECYTIESVVAHEFGHHIFYRILADSKAMSFLGEDTMAQGLEGILNDMVDERIAAAAEAGKPIRNKFGRSITGRGQIRQSIIEEVSGYAQQSNHEMFAEIFSEWYIRGDRSSELTRRVMELVDDTYREEFG